MKIEHHPDASTLMSYAAGSLPEALSAVVAAHIEMCPACAAEVRAMELIGAALFERLEPQTAMVRKQPDANVASLAVVPELLADGDDDEHQSVLSRLIGRELSEVHWKRLGFGIWHYPIKLSPESTGDLRLLKVAPGQVMPEHSHGGSELTLVLSGAYRDDHGRYRVGDLSDLGDDVDHQPISDATEGCICLIASDERAKFKNVMARIAQPFTGL